MSNILIDRCNTDKLGFIDKHNSSSHSMYNSLYFKYVHDEIFIGEEGFFGVIKELKVCIRVFIVHIVE